MIIRKLVLKSATTRTIAAAATTAIASSAVAVTTTTNTIFPRVIASFLTSNPTTKAVATRNFVPATRTNALRNYSNDDDMTTSRATMLLEENGYVRLDDGTELPYTRQMDSPVDIIMAHGLGSDPPTKHHYNDIIHDLWNDCRKEIIDMSLKNDKTDSSSSPPPPPPQPLFTSTAVLYTARGHGNSRGWDRHAKEYYESIATKHENQNDDKDESTALFALAEPFTWPALAHDMKTVADQTIKQHPDDDDTPFVVFGQSMGAGTALYFASMDSVASRNGNETKSETRSDPTTKRRRMMKGLILARPPRMWDTRQACRKDMITSAMLMKRQNPGRYDFLPILGAAQTDLPTDPTFYHNHVPTNIPVLILCHGQDENHPLESGHLLSKHLIPHATLHNTAIDEIDARRIWPKIIADWLEKQGFVQNK